jgi:hypothetical protein
MESGQRHRRVWRLAKCSIPESGPEYFAVETVIEDYFRDCDGTGSGSIIVRVLIVEKPKTLPYKTSLLKKVATRYHKDQVRQTSTWKIDCCCWK